MVKTGYMSPAELVIELFGGVRPLARVLGKNPSSVSRWVKHSKRYKKFGAVPTSMQAELLDLAKKRGLMLTAEELMRGKML